MLNLKLVKTDGIPLNPLLCNSNETRREFFFLFQAAFCQRGWIRNRRLHSALWQTTPKSKGIAFLALLNCISASFCHFQYSQLTEKLESSFNQQQLYPITFQLWHQIHPHIRTLPLLKAGKVSLHYQSRLSTLFKFRIFFPRPIVTSSLHVLPNVRSSTYGATQNQSSSGFSSLPNFLHLLTSITQLTQILSQWNCWRWKILRQSSNREIKRSIFIFCITYHKWHPWRIRYTHLLFAIRAGTS